MENNIGSSEWEKRKTNDWSLSYSGQSFGTMLLPVWVGECIQSSDTNDSLWRWECARTRHQKKVPWCKWLAPRFRSERLRVRIKRSATFHTIGPCKEAVLACLATDIKIRYLRSDVCQTGIKTDWKPCPLCVPAIPKLDPWVYELGAFSGPKQDTMVPRSD